MFLLLLLFFIYVYNSPVCDCVSVQNKTKQKNPRRALDPYLVTVRVTLTTVV